ncbi:hypothetical protein PORY_000723 [Pneumocystis oryctolagi]|uniref:Uncharacterized protein n=1 Tax=Pneumocystis oryctolagi TaxID=42067 RepID=A0ACB7CFT0_9ASCO|nr:hypothetical protein PORY_000723 [Pneumocystis oryctolagi]
MKDSNEDSYSCDKDIDKSFLNWRNTMMYALGIKMDENSRKKYETVRDSVYEKSMNRRCEVWKEYIWKNSASVRFMTKHLDALKVKLSLDDIICRPCSEMQSGGFDPPKGIFLCQNKIQSKSHMEDTLVHEMVHAYDHARFIVDWNNLLHRSCSEVRAASLSGECRWWKEFKNGAISTFRKHHQECVKRRSILSVSKHPACKDMEHAKQVVMQVFESCFTDTRPYDESNDFVYLTDSYTHRVYHLETSYFMKPSEDVDLFALRTTELIHKIDEASSTLLSRFCQIIEIASNEGKDRCMVASESYQIEIHVVSMIRSVEELLLVSRAIKEAWILCETEAWDAALGQVLDEPMPPLENVSKLLEQYQRIQSSEDAKTKQYSENGMTRKYERIFTCIGKVCVECGVLSLTLIVALTVSRGIGRENNLPWKLKSDMMFFNQVTSGLPVTCPVGQMNVVLMGRKTWESLPLRSRPLKNRINVVISHQKVLDLAHGVHHARSLDDALTLLSRVYGPGSRNQVNRIFVIGGAQLYKVAMEHPKLNRIIATVIYNEIDCDVFFPVDFRNSSMCFPWKKQDHSVLESWIGFKIPQGKINENGLDYEFEMWMKDTKKVSESICESVP